MEKQNKSTSILSEDDSDVECSDNDCMEDSDYYNPPDDNDVEQLDPASKDPEFFQFECLTEEQVEILFNETVELLSNKLGVPPSLAKVLLHVQGWAVPIIAAKYRVNPDHLLITSKVKAPYTVPKQSLTSIYMMCSVCIVLNTSDKFYGLSCAHHFCKECWSLYFEIQVSQGVSTAISCMARNCEVLAPEDFVLKHLTRPIMREKYHQFSFQDYVKSHPELKFCPGPNCQMVIRSREPKAKRSQCFRCKTVFCFNKVAATSEGKKWLSRNWKLCKPLEKDEEINVLFEWLQDVYSNMAMVNYPYPTDFIINLPANPVKTFCNKLRWQHSDPHKLLHNLGKALSVYFNNTGTADCMDISSDLTKIDSIGWDFQSCTELIMPMCSKESDIFIPQVWNFTEYSEKCFNKWKINTSSERLAILEYGGKDLLGTSNIVFSNGLLDPWSGGGVLKNISKTVVAYIMPDAAHHLDLRSFHPNDPPSVIAARGFHRRAIKDWLRSFYIDHSNKNIE